MTNMDLFAIKGNVPVVTNTSFNNGISCRVGLNSTEKGGIITYSDTTTWEAIFYQPEDFIGYSHIQGLYPYEKKWTKGSLLYLVTVFKKAVINRFDYGNKFNRNLAKDIVVKLPVRNNKIDFDLMEKTINNIELKFFTQLKEYFISTGLDNYILTEEEIRTLKRFNEVKWEKYNLEILFGKSTRGKRLKGADRIKGNLPFVTAGEACEGISAYISNDVEIFKNNTITIDMFGSAKYRNYQYGADDHVAVVHTEKLPKNVVIFITTAIHKSAHSGMFDYSKNFYAKDADALFISLPVNNNNIDYDYMEKFVSAIHKIVMKNVILYINKNIDII